MDVAVEDLADHRPDHEPDHRPDHQPDHQPDHRPGHPSGRFAKHRVGGEREFDHTPQPLRCPPHHSTASASASAPLADVLAALGERVAPTSMARERTLPVAAEYAGLFTDGLVRGRVLSCAGDAATTVALGLVAEAVAAGSWVAVIDVPTLGLDAASELGVPLERIVAVTSASAGETEGEPVGARWADVVAAAADGFDVMIVRVPADVRPATVRKVATRLQQRGAVMVVLGDPGAFVADGVVESVCLGWGEIGTGWGHLRHRSVEVSATGRRLPGRRSVVVTTPGDAIASPSAAGTAPGIAPGAAAVAPHRHVDVAEFSTAS